MGWLDTVVDIAGTGLSLWASKEKADAAEDIADDNAAAKRAEGKANAELSLYDAAVTEGMAIEQFKSYQRNLDVHYQKLDAFVGSQRARYAKSGVVTETGSPLSVMTETFRRGYEDANIIQYNGQKAIKQTKSLAERYRKLASKNLRDSAVYASLIEESGSNAAFAYQMEGLSTGISSIYKSGKEAGWWF